MNQNRDEFPANVKDALAKRASYICSNPDCRALTMASAEFIPGKFTSAGIVAHITAASPGGPRYDSRLSEEDRRSPDNGIFLSAYPH